MAGEDLAAVSLGDILDGLPFPALGSAVIAGASFASHKVMYKNRKFLNRFAARIGRFKHPRRALWLTDTLHDPNGVSTALGSLLEEIQKRDLPIDLLVCDDRNKPGASRLRAPGRGVQAARVSIAGLPDSRSPSIAGCLPARVVRPHRGFNRARDGIGGALSQEGFQRSCVLLHSHGLARVRRQMSWARFARAR